MIIIGTTIATSTQDIKDLMQHIILHQMEGRINLTIAENGEINVWQPKNMPVAESVTRPIERFPATDEYHEPQPSDIS